MAVHGLYAIADIETLAKRGLSLREFAEGLRTAGVSLVQYRDKHGSPQQVLAGATLLREVFRDTECVLIMNDRVDLAVIANFDGVHLGQEDLSPNDARAVFKRSSNPGSPKLIGISTHTGDQVRLAEGSSADYLAIGPVFATGTKADVAAVGLDGVRRARSLTTKPLVAIGGITRANARSVVEAGADCVAVISGLLVEGESVEKVARDFMAIFG